MNYGGFFDYSGKKTQLEQIEIELENPEIWNNQDNAQELSRKKKQLETVVNSLDNLGNNIASCKELFDMARAENDEDTILMVDSLNVAAASAVAFWQLCPHVSNEYHYQPGLYH